jgi:biopolymer transport protein ExbD
MSMSVGSASGQQQEMCDINTTPLIDVMLVLLVTLIISLPVMTHAVKLDMPNPNAQPPPPDQQPEVINLEIDGDGTVVWNGNPVTGIPQLEGYFASETVKDPQPEIHLRPDRRARYDVVAKVLAAAQRNHMKKIGFVNVAEFKD